jgi:hypothetical protein
MRSDRLRLFLLSFLMLFVELALIRWTGSNVVYLSYFSNFVLLGSFLGIGLGFLRAKAKVDLFPYAPIALLGLVCFVLFFPVEIDRSGSNLIYYGGKPSGLPLWVVLPIIFVAVATVMMTIGEGVARVFARFEPLEAYRLDILGSLAGIGMFTLLSFLRMPPFAWALIAAVLFAVLLRGHSRILTLAPLVVLLVAIGAESVQPNDSWSPYYKVTAFEPEELPGSLAINVNGIPHQTMLAGEMRERVPENQRPYELLDGAPDNLLIIGAGNGMDVAAALDAGAGHVDAVEIDPRIHDLGASRNPDQPYADPRVRAIVDDGRAVLEQSDTRYDMIVFALPDSLSLVSGQSSLRLESYLFTEEAFESARDHLTDDGVFVMYNAYREPWLVDRMAGTLDATFGSAPCVEESPNSANFAILAVANDGRELPCAAWVPTGAVVTPATDDAPFPYLRDRSIPTFYLVAIALILGASLVLVRLASGPIRQMAPYVDLFFMGAAFLLLETKSVVQFALLFGTTWLVNALVFAGVLLAVYLAIELSRRVVVRRPILIYVGLLASLVVAWMLPAAALLELSPVPRFVIAVVTAFTPIFLANLVFSQRFRDVGSSTTAFGANLLGAVAGGLLEYAALITGYRALLIVVAVLYGAAFVFGQRTWMRGRPAPVEVGLG